MTVSTACLRVGALVRTFSCPYLCLMTAVEAAAAAAAAATPTANATMIVELQSTRATHTSGRSSSGQIGS